ncbi:MAG: TIGR01212 family radical SAM protein [Spirochaetales bacterium]|nr:TIGR01212 family radical SAM protein [Spirochaetales bacterium]
MSKAREPYYSYKRYLSERYGTTVYRVSVDAGFSCPHRGADRSGPGCIFCGPEGARAPYLGDSSAGDESGRLEAQIRGALEFLKKRYGAREFILYFQAYSNTNAPAARLKELYDRGLSQADFRELVVSTRPDCVDREKADLLASYKNGRRDVWIELGLQSFHDRTLERINRGHTAADFRDAFALCRERGLKICVHLVFGLPGEGRPEIEATVRELAALGPDGVKIHNLHVIAGTPLAEEYARGLVKVPGAAEHLERVIGALELLGPKTVIMRLVCDTPPARLVAPRDFPDKQRFLALLRAEMARRGSCQGKSHPGGIYP